ncbi:MAG: hypothetical protein WC806_02055 [Candidatus Gracilibacteria bacterium]|jgi:hypothetical protein
MIIHCLTCGKSVSSHHFKCPYCCAEISEITMEANGIELKENTKEKFMNIMLRFANK